MKKLLYIVVLITVFTMSVVAIEQNFPTKSGHQLTLVQDREYTSTDKKFYSQSITTSILPILIVPWITGFIPVGLAYEIKLGNAISIQPNAAFYIPRDYGVYWYELGLNFRWYFTKKALQGGYLGPSVDFVHSNNMRSALIGFGPDADVPRTSISFSVLFTLGYQWILDGFLFDIHLSGGYTHELGETAKIFSFAHHSSVFGSGFGYELGLSMGYAW